MEKSLPTLEEVIKEFSERVTAVIAEIGEKYKGKIVRGYRASSYQNHVNELHSQLELCNSIFHNVAKFTGVRCKPADIKQMLASFDSPQALIDSLKEEYVLRDKKLKDLPLKKDVLIQAYDFGDHSKYLDAVSESLSVFPKANKATELMKYFDEKNNQFVISEDQETELMERYTMYASVDALAEAMDLEMFASSLSDLRRFDYDFRALPELPVKLMQVLDMKRVSVHVNPSLEFNVHTFNNYNRRHWTDEPIEDSINGGIKIRNSDQLQARLQQIRDEEDV